MCATPAEETQTKYNNNTQFESTDSEFMNSEDLNAIISVPEESITVTETGEKSYTLLYIGVGIASLLLLIICIIIIIFTIRSSD